MSDEFNWGYTRPKADTVGKHTPGLQITSKTEIGGETIYISKEGTRLNATIHAIGNGYEENKEFSNLIAAAPELLEALKEAEQLMQKMHTLVSKGLVKVPFGCVATSIDKAQQAIAKAEGRISDSPMGRA